MSNKQKSDASFEISLTEFLEIYLREDFSREIKPALAEIVEAISLNKCICFIQWTDHEGRLLKSPILWRYKYWVDCTEKWLESKRKSEADRIRKYIFDANVKRVSKEFMCQCNMDENRAIDTAISVLIHNRIGALRMLGVKLIVSEDEL